MSRRKTYDTNMSPAAKRRQLNGKRKPTDFGNFEYRPDMSDYEILEAWEQENKRDWTQHLPSVQEQNRAMNNRKSSSAGARKNTNKRDGKVSARNDVGKSTKQSNMQRSGKNNNTSRVKKQSGSMKIYALSVWVLLISLLVVNILPIFILGPIALMVFIPYLKLKGRHSANIKVLLYTAINTIGSIGLILVLLVMLYVSDFNYGIPGLGMGTSSVYISGIDTYGEITSTSRSDVNLVATVNQFTGQSILTTTPRDYYVVLPGVSGSQRDKLTHAGVYGIETSMATLEQLYNTEINSYIRVNFSSVIDIIDALGGVTVDSEFEFTTSSNAGCVVHITEGRNHLTGEEALAFVRERYAFVDGDAQRGRNQQALFKGLLSSAISPNGIINLDNVLLSVGANVETNMTVCQMQMFLKSMIKGTLYTEMQTAEATGSGSKAQCYSYSGGNLYVTIPDEVSLGEIKSTIDGISAGKIYYKWVN